MRWRCIACALVLLALPIATLGITWDSDDDFFGIICHYSGEGHCYHPAYSFYFTGCNGESGDFARLWLDWNFDEGGCNPTEYNMAYADIYTETTFEDAGWYRVHLRYCLQGSESTRAEFRFEPPPFYDDFVLDLWDGTADPSDENYMTIERVFWSDPWGGNEGVRIILQGDNAQGDPEDAFLYIDWITIEWDDAVGVENTTWSTLKAAYGP